MSALDPTTAVREAVRSILSRWTALHLATSHSDAPNAPSIAANLLEDFTTLALSVAPRARSADYELLCGDSFGALGASVEDGSVSDVIAAVVRVRDAAEAGDVASAAAEIAKGFGGTAVGESAGEVGVGEAGESGSESGSESGGSAMEEDSRVTEPEVDDDGFTTVRRQTRSVTRGSR